MTAIVKLELLSTATSEQITKKIKKNKTIFFFFLNFWQATSDSEEERMRWDIPQHIYIFICIYTHRTSKVKETWQQKLNTRCSVQTRICQYKALTTNGWPSCEDHFPKFQEPPSMEHPKKNTSFVNGQSKRGAFLYLMSLRIGPYVLLHDWILYWSFQSKYWT